VLNFVLGQLEYFGENKKQALAYFDRCIELTKSRSAREQLTMGLALLSFLEGISKSVLKMIFRRQLTLTHGQLRSIKR
jgi:hypothetical protein